MATLAAYSTERAPCVSVVGVRLAPCLASSVVARRSTEATELKEGCDDQDELPHWPDRAQFQYDDGDRDPRDAARPRGGGAFIHTNHHLPEIPKAGEVEAAGVSLGHMQSKLLLKVEELMLYLIQQNKTIEKLTAKLARLEQPARKRSIGDVPTGLGFACRAYWHPPRWVAAMCCVELSAARSRADGRYAPLPAAGSLTLALPVGSGVSFGALSGSARSRGSLMLTVPITVLRCMRRSLS